MQIVLTLPYVLRLGWVLPFYKAVGVDAALLYCCRRGCCPFILLLDVDEALYLPVCGNTDVTTTFSRGTAAILLPPSILDAFYAPFQLPAPLRTFPKWSHPMKKLGCRAGCGLLCAPAG